MQIIAMLVTNMQVHIDRLHLEEKKKWINGYMYERISK